jgi:putative ABC transport system permease protein
MLTQPGYPAPERRRRAASRRRAGRCLAAADRDPRDLGRAGRHPHLGSGSSGFEGLAIADIATAQEIAGRIGTIDRIDLVLAPEDASVLAEALPPGLRLVASAQRSETLRQMTRAFHTNLTAMSLLAMLVGGFIIYNTMTFAVLQRRSLLGSLRTLGCTRAQLFELVLSEAMLFALAGALLGLALGILTGWGLVQLVTRTINDIYFTLTVRELFITPLSVVKGIAADS